MEIGWKAEGGYELRAVYVDTRPVQSPQGTEVASIDIGELRIGAVHYGDQVDLHSGRLIRARNHYANKTTALLDARISHKKNQRLGGHTSKRCRRLQRARRHLRDRVGRQNRDQLRKQARLIVSTLHEHRVQTVAVGDLGNIRLTTKTSRQRNQNLHQWVFGQFLTELRGQCRKFGLELALVDESWTSQTCPWNGGRRKPKGRVFISPCGQYVLDRDAVGAVNTRAKYLETRAGKGTAFGPDATLPWTPVLAGMAPVTRGVRFRVSHALGTPIRRGTAPEAARIPGL